MTDEEVSRQMGEPCDNPDACPDPVGCGFEPGDTDMERARKWLAGLCPVEGPADNTEFSRACSSLAKAIAAPRTEGERIGAERQWRPIETAPPEPPATAERIEARQP